MKKTPHRVKYNLQLFSYEPPGRPLVAIVFDLRYPALPS